MSAWDLQKNCCTRTVRPGHSSKATHPITLWPWDNTGLKRVSAGEHGESYKDLLYVRRKFIHKDNLRNAISEVVNAIFRVRMQEIWGNTTSSYAFWYDFLARHMLSDCGVEQVYEDFCNNWE
ncbi:hypothetical protein EDM58_12255 [Brevibacillus panacihumi]|uniref:Tn3 transposase DDE domain-containing protein n=1 Tax=Brevibacillus panacihumi TaxID=497735 RepID=A0A3M8CR54_9BACL|nr:hypothetical protein EDM58_12255 [Brevibacillus panacihumi]